MLEESLFANAPLGRRLRSSEVAIIKRLLVETYDQESLNEKLANAWVDDMQDGGMGSIRFLTSTERERKMGRVLVEAEYIDEDGVLVSIAVNCDQNDNLYEMDLWKVDFSPLKRYPAPSDLKSISFPSKI